MMRLLLGLVLLVACTSDPTGEFTFRGTVEVREIDVAPLASGRVLDLRVDEGALVEVGDTIAILDAPTLVADLVAGEAQVAIARAQLRDLEAGSRPEELARAEAELRGRIAEAARLARDRDRLKSLLDAGAVAPRDYEAVATAAEVAARAAEAGRDGLQLLRAGARSGQVAAARASVERAEATLSALRAATDEFVLVAPRAGVVLQRLREPGDLVTAGVPVVRLGMTAEPWVRVFVPASMLGTIQLGDSASVLAAGNALAGATGTVVAINPRAEYVTRTALSEEERADLLFGVKLTIDDPEGRFKAGMPTTVVFRPATAP